MVVNALRDVVYVWLTTSQASFVHPAFFSGSCVLFMGPASTFFFFKKTTLKLDPTVLFIYLKIILLQCF